ncbi:MAG TPA: pYEATS domain-containing protein, partial [Gemmatimonadaceae bacterium]|nr:pYEATS domain-containing protein [Gemmatimonadaceae bacterium]
WKDRNQAWRDVVRGIEAAVKQTTAPATASEQNSTAGRTREVGRGFFLNHISFLRPEKQQEFRERTGVQLDHYDIRVVVDAEHPELLDSIERIEYTLDPAYPEDVRVRTARDRRTKFLLKEIANGEYVLRAKVFIRGEPKAIELERYLTLWRSGPELP